MNMLKRKSVKRRDSLDLLAELDEEEDEDFVSDWSRFYKLVDISVKLKIIVGSCQVVSGLATRYYADFPPAFQKIASVYALVSIDVFNVIDFGCAVPETSFYMNLLVSTIMPILITMLILGVHFPIEATIRGTPRLVRELRSATFTVWLVLLFLIYPGVSQTVLQTFVCDTFDDGNTVLRADYSLSCLEDRYYFYWGYAMFMIFVYVLGIPLVYWYALHHSRRELMVGQTSGWAYKFDKLIANQRERNTHIDHLRFLYRPYEPVYYNWEVLELFRKLAQTSLSQFLFDMMMTMSFLMLLLWLRPYLEAPNDVLAITVQWAILVLTFLGLLNRMQISQGQKEASQDFLDAITIIAVITPIVLAIVQIFVELYTDNAYKTVFYCCFNRKERVWKKVAKRKGKERQANAKRVVSTRDPPRRADASVEEEEEVEAPKLRPKSIKIVNPDFERMHAARGIDDPANAASVRQLKLFQKESSRGLKLSTKEEEDAAEQAVEQAAEQRIEDDAAILPEDVVEHVRALEFLELVKDRDDFEELERARKRLTLKVAALDTAMADLQDALTRTDDDALSNEEIEERKKAALLNARVLQAITATVQTRTKDYRGEILPEYAPRPNLTAKIFTKLDSLTLLLGRKLAAAAPSSSRSMGDSGRTNAGEVSYLGSSRFGRSLASFARRITPPDPLDRYRVYGRAVLLAFVFGVSLALALAL